MAGDVGEGGGGLQEVGVVELRLPHEQPAVFQEGIILLLGLLSHQLRVVLPAGLLGRLGLDGVELDGLVALLDGSVEGASRLRLVFGLRADGIHEDLLGVVLLIPLLLAPERLVEGLLAVEIDIVAGGEGMIETARFGVLLRAARPKQEHHADDPDKTIPSFHSFFNGTINAFIAFNAKNTTTKKRMMKAPEGTFR